MKDLQWSRHAINKLGTVVEEKRDNLSYKIRSAFILQLSQLSELIIQKSL